MFFNVPEAVRAETFGASALCGELGSTDDALGTTDRHPRATWGLARATGLPDGHTCSALAGRPHAPVPTCLRRAAASRLHGSACAGVRTNQSFALIRARRAIAWRLKWADIDAWRPGVGARRPYAPVSSRLRGPAASGLHGSAYAAVRTVQLFALGRAGRAVAWHHWWARVGARASKVLRHTGRRIVGGRGRRRGAAAAQDQETEKTAQTVYVAHAQKLGPNVAARQ